MRRLILSLVLICCGNIANGLAAEPLRVAVFQADVTPPIGAPLCYGAVKPAKEIVGKLSARGLVILTADKPIVLCAVDWVLTSNGGYNEFREALAKAAGTPVDHVAVHTLHPHDTPGVDFTLEELLSEIDLSGKTCDVAASRQAIQRTADAVRKSLSTARPLTHLGYGRAKVEKVASNRRILGPDGKVKAIRWSAVTDKQLHEAPEGTIDPYLQLLSFWDNDQAIASVTYYATHPQSFYNVGGVTPDIPGIARAQRETETPEIAHIHFNGASGNITAGKYNNGSKENRPVLAGRLADGMRAAWKDQKKIAVTAQDVQWRVQPVALPPARDLDASKLEKKLRDPKASTEQKTVAAIQLIWLRRCQAGEKIDLSCLKVGPAYVLHMPGELFIEYQLAAQKLRPNDYVLMAAYGDDATGYIGTKIAYSQGGYETGPASRVSPEVEDVLLKAIAELLK